MSKQQQLEKVCQERANAVFAAVYAHHSTAAEARSAAHRVRMNGLSYPGHSQARETTEIIRDANAAGSIASRDAYAKCIENNGAL